MNHARHRHNSLRQPPALWVRLAVVLLGAVQVVAPSWHVCELGGTCCRPNTGIGNFTCALKMGGPDSCHRCQPHPGHGLSATHLITFQGECLAQLLQSMPASLLATPFVTRLQVRYARLPDALPTAPRSALPRRTAVRGPPTDLLA